MTSDNQGKDKKPASPWGQRPRGNGGASHGDNDRPQQGRPYGSGNRPRQEDLPDLDAVLRGAHERLFGGRGGQGGRPQNPNIPFLPDDPLKMLLLGIGVILFVWLASGLYRVLPEENAVVLTFGKWSDTRTAPGLGYHIPWPVQDVQKVNVTLDRRIEIGFRGSNERASNDIPGESLMLTGDENIVDIDFVVTWRINEAGSYLFAIRNPEDTIKKVAESAMREVIGRTQIQSALTEGRAQVESATRILMQGMLDDYKSGVVINEVQLQRVDPPQAVVDAFNDVQRARADRERARNEAEAYRNGVIPQARGESQKRIQEAEGYKQAVIARATGDASRFLDVYTAYSTSKDVTEKRMYLETMESILAQSRKVILDGNASRSGVLPYLPLDKISGGTPSQTPAPKTAPAQQ